VDEQAVAAWLDGYSRAWKTYDPEQIGELFSEDAVYFDNPFDEPVRGREAIVASWLEDPDEEGTYEGRYRPVLVAGDQSASTPPPPLPSLALPPPPGRRQWLQPLPQRRRRRRQGVRQPAPAPLRRRRPLRRVPRVVHAEAR
jgi:hypothetical protein